MEQVSAVWKVIEDGAPGAGNQGDEELLSGIGRPAGVTGGFSD